MPRRSLLWLRATIALLLLGGTATAEDAAKPPPPPDLRFNASGWAGDGIVNAEDGRFLACGAAARFAPDVTLELAVDRRFDLTLQLSSPRWRFPVGSVHEIDLPIPDSPPARAVRRDKLAVAFGNDPRRYSALFDTGWITATLSDGTAQFFVQDGPGLLRALRRCAERGLRWERAAHRGAPIAQDPVDDTHWCAPTPLGALSPWAGALSTADPTTAPVERAALNALLIRAGVGAAEQQPENIRRRSFPDARQAWRVGGAFGALQRGAAGEANLATLDAGQLDGAAFRCAEGFSADVTQQERLKMGALARIRTRCDGGAQPTVRFLTAIRSGSDFALIEHCADPDGLAAAFQLDEAVAFGAAAVLAGWR